MLHFYEVGLKWVLRNRLFSLLVAIGTLVLTIYLFLIVPKGLLPQQDTGEIIGVTDAAQNISFKAMLEKQRQVSDIVEKDPDVQGVAAFVGAGTVNATTNTGRLYIVLKPRDERQSSADQIMARLSAATKDLQGISLFLQSVQG